MLSECAHEHTVASMYHAVQARRIIAKPALAVCLPVVTTIVNAGTAWRPFFQLLRDMSTNGDIIHQARGGAIALAVLEPKQAANCQTAALETKSFLYIRGTPSPFRPSCAAKVHELVDSRTEGPSHF